MMISEAQVGSAGTSSDSANAPDTELTANQPIPATSELIAGRQDVAACTRTRCG